MRNIMCLLLLSIMLCDCSSSNVLPSMSSTVDTQDSISKESVQFSKAGSSEKNKANEQNMYSETNEDGIRLELIDVSGSDPLYTLTFKKKDTNSGKYLNFVNSRPKKGVGLPNIDVKVEPDSGYGYWAGPDDECHVNIYNINRNDLIKIRISGIEYTFTPNKEETKEKVIDKSVQIKDGSVTIKKAVLYPEYLALYLDENIGKAYDNIFWAIDAEGKRKVPIVYEQEDGKVLIYRKDDVIYDNVLHLQGKQSEGYKNIDIELN